MLEADIRNGTQGVFLGPNPEAPYKGLYLTYWEAIEISESLGLPSPEVYAEQKKLIDEQAQDIINLESQLEHEIHSLQLNELAKEVRKAHKEIIGEIQSYNGAVRARLGSSGSDAAAPKGAAKPRTGAAGI
jgi:4-diphosphocytidyl-2C-methyl-D-erythritol kinase